MPEITPPAVSILEAKTILSNLGLDKQELTGKSILDLGSGKNDFANAMAFLQPSTKVVSVDSDRNREWIKLLEQAKETTVQADALQLPFESNSFDTVIAHGSIYPIDIEDAVRVLKPGGEIRIFPIGDQVLQEYWYTMYYMEHYQGKTQQEAMEYIQNVDSVFRETGGEVPNEYVALREKALDKLTPEEKCSLVDMMVHRYEEITGLHFDYFIHDTNAREPVGAMLYTKTI